MEQLLKAILEILKALFGKKENTMSGASNEVVPPQIESGETTDENNAQDSGGTEQEGAMTEFVSPVKILIDNGHGNDTAGKRSPYSAYKTKPAIDFYEYKWNREIAVPLAERLRALGYDAELIVPEENDISLKERVERVNKYCREIGTFNVIFISVHANAAGNGKEWYSARGWSAYTTPGNTKSDAFAECLYDAAEKNFVGQKIRTDKSDGDRDWEANFYVLKNTFCAAVLTENFFYDNVDDVKYILSEEGREAVIKTHVEGIVNYIKTLPK